MLKNYFKIAIRNLLKNKSYLIINSAGMGIAIACCMSAYLLIAYNIEFDAFYEDEKMEDVVKVISHMEHQNGEPYQNLVAPYVLAPIAMEGISGVENYTRYCIEGGSVSNGEDAFTEAVGFADSSFFELAEFNMLHGSIESFKDQKSIMLSEKLAKKYFADEDPTDQILILEFRGKTYELAVGGVFEQPPLNSSFVMDALVRMEHFGHIYDIGPNNWKQWREVSTLFKLADINQIDAVTEQLNKYVQVRNESKRDTKVTGFELIPFNEPLSGDEVSWRFLNVKIEFFPLMIFVTLAFIILLIACFNLTNTTIALTLKRLKEIGVRKVVGARRGQVITQFLFEITITITLSILVGLVMSLIIVPEFAAMWGLEYGLQDLNGINLIFSLLIILFLSALLAGAYPAINNSKYKPVSLLKGATKVKGTNPLTRVLLVIQFSLSVIVLVGGVIFTLNAEFQKNVSFGYNAKKILTVSVQSESQYNKLRSSIQSNSKIEDISVTAMHLGRGSYRNPIKIDTTEFQTHVYEITSGYFKVMGMNIVDGRDFIEDSQLDLEESCIVDESFVTFNNLENPIDTRLTFQEKKYRIVGVVQDHLSNLFNQDDLEEGHFYRLIGPEQYGLLIARIDENDHKEVVADIEAKWKELFPNKPFESRSQEDILFEGAIQTNRNLTQIFLFITILGCLLSASGIYSLAKLNIEKRTKEIGVRKVLGATITSIVRLINKEFAIILGSAMIIGAVGGYFLTNILLDEIYATHIDVSYFTLALCGLFIFLVGIATTSGTIFRAAVANPAHTLRDE